MVRIELNNIRLHAYHGVHQIEKENGSEFRVDVSFEYNADSAIESDSIADALDYERVLAIVERCMADRKELIETLASTIQKEIQHDFDSAKAVRIKICKLNPPVKLAINEICVLVE